MSDSANEPRGGFLGIRAWVWSVVIFCFILVVVFLVLAKEPARVSASTSLEPLGSDNSKEAVDSPATMETPVHSPDPLPPATQPPPAEEMEYAEFTFDNHLAVILPSSSSLGAISVERYDSEGNPTGEPLKSGTQVQIPDPDNPGEKIYFRVP
jgi:hypothetical protein